MGSFKSSIYITRYGLLFCCILFCDIIYTNTLDNNNNAGIINIDGIIGNDYLCNSTNLIPCKSIEKGFSIASNGYKIIIKSNTIYNCSNDGRGFIIDSKNLQIISSDQNSKVKLNCFNNSRGFWFIDSSVYLSGFHIINGFTNDTYGGSAALITFSPDKINISNFIHNWSNNVIENHLNINGSTLSFIYSVDTNNNIHNISNSLFISNVNSVTNINILTLASSNINNSYIFNNCIFANNSLYSESLEFLLTTSSVININHISLHDNHNEHNRYIFLNCSFINNDDSGSVSSIASSGAINIIHSSRYGNNVNNNNVYEFVHCSFRNNVGGNNHNNINQNSTGDPLHGSPFSAAGAVNIAIITEQLNTVNFVNANRYLFSYCEFIENSGGNNNNNIIPRTELENFQHLVSNLAAISSALNIAYITFGTNINKENKYLFISCSFISNRGTNSNGNILAPSDENSYMIEGLTSVVLGVAVNIAYLSLQNSLNSSINISNNHTFIQCTFSNNTGGNNNANIGSYNSTTVYGNSYGVISSGLTIAYSTGNIKDYTNNNIHSFINCMFQANNGANNNGNVYVREEATTFISISASLIISYLSWSNKGLGETRNNIHDFISTHFIDNNGGNNNSLISNIEFGTSTTIMSGSAGININYMRDITFNSNNSHLLDNCSFFNNIGGNDNAVIIPNVSPNITVFVYVSCSSSLAISFLSFQNNNVNNTFILLNTYFVSNNGGNRNGQVLYNENTVNEESSRGTSIITSAGAIVISYIGVNGDSNNYNSYSFNLCKYFNNSGGNRIESEVPEHLKFIHKTAIASSGALTIAYMSDDNNPNSNNYNLHYFNNSEFSANIDGDGNGATNSRFYGATSGAVTILYFSVSTNSNEHNHHIFSSCIFDSNEVYVSNNPEDFIFSSGGLALGIGIHSDITDNYYYFDSCHFSKNIAESAINHAQSGGAISLVLPLCTVSECDDLVNFVNCIFVGNNVVEQSGGAIGLYSEILAENFVASIINSTFMNNSATCFDSCCCLGGGLMLNSIGGKFVNCNFISNNASFGGGAIALVRGAVLDCTNCMFAMNSAGPFGNDISQQNFNVNPVLLQDSSIFILPSTTSIESISITSSVGYNVIILSNTILSCPHNYEIIYSDSGYGCRLCPSETYNIINSTLIDEVQTGCLVCPFGGSCSLGNIYSKQGFWGYTNNGTIKFTFCPVDYCCPLDICNSFNTCNGKRTGILCGECEIGYTESLGTANCIEISNCDSLSWFIPLSFIIGTIIALYLLFSDTSGGYSNIITYYFQLAGLIISEQSGTRFYVLIKSALIDLFNLQASSGGNSICISPNLTGVGKQLFYILITPLFVLIPLIILWILYYVKRTRLYLTSKNISITSNNIGTGFIRLLLFIYSTLTLRMLNLIHCIPIEGLSGLYLFKAGYVECYQSWQQLLLFLLIVILIIPIILLWYIYRYSKKSVIHMHTNGNNDKFSLSYTVFKVIGKPYKLKYEYWECVLLIFRLINVLTATFITIPAVTLVILFLLSFIMLFIHLYFQPFNNHLANILQTIVLTCLILLTLLGISSATVTSVGDKITGSYMIQIIELYNLFQAIILFIPLIFVLFYLIKGLFTRIFKKYQLLYRDGTNNPNSDNSSSILLQNHDDRISDEEKSNSNSFSSMDDL